MGVHPCPACGHAVSAEAKFCSECGTALQTATVTAEGERRQLTALFCDLVGSTELSSRVDPEEFSELIHGYQQRAGAVIERYEGEIARLMGDGVLAHFGWPEAHDDDAEYAVRAALEIVDEIERFDRELPPEARLAVRIGVHTGPVVIEEVIRAGRQETMALGETMNLASRLERVAEPNTVVITDATLRLVRGVFVTEDLGPQELKGISEPVRAHRVVQPAGVRSRFDAARETLTPLVGREGELRAIADCWEQAREGNGLLALVTGQPGVGKSRLVYEFRERIKATPHSWLEARCSSYTQQSAFRPVIELIEEGLRLEGDDDPQTKLEKLERGLEFGDLPVADTAPLIATLLAIPLPEGLAPLAMSAELRRRRTIDALSDWVLGLARPQPMVVLIEDLHWCDPSSLELLESLLEKGEGHSLMLLATGRPEFQHPWEESARLRAVEVSPLDEVEVRTLLAELAGGRELPDSVLERVVGEADGIPLYAEEMARMMLESGLLVAGEGRWELTAPLEELQIPTTLQGSLMARLDRISAAKRVAQRAAVIGREFSYELLRAVTDLEPVLINHGLASLVAADLLVQRGEPPRASYAFKHALIQDAAYESLLKRTRRALHATIGEALEERFAHDPAGAPEAVARHFEAAGRLRPAVRHYRSAAEKAAEGSAHREAIAHLRKVISLLAELPRDAEADQAEVESQLALASSIMAIHSYASPEARVAYERARELCERLGEGTRVASVLVGLAIFYINQAALDEGEALARRALSIGEREEDDAVCLLARVQLSLPSLYRGELEAALTHCDAATAIYDRERHRPIAFSFGTDQGVAADDFASWALLFLGRPDAAVDRVRRGVALARTFGHSPSLGHALFFESGLHWLRGDYEAMRSTAGELLAIGEEQGFDLWLGLGRLCHGGAIALGSGEERGIAELIEGSQLAAATGTRGGLTGVFALVADAQRAVGQADAAQAAIDAALSFSADTGQPWFDPCLLTIQGEIAMGRGVADEERGRRATECFRRAIGAARQHGNRFDELRAATGLGRLLLARGREEEARACVETLYRGFGEGFGTKVLADAGALLAELGVEVRAGAGGGNGAQPAAKPSVG